MRRHMVARSALVAVVTLAAGFATVSGQTRAQQRVGRQQDVRNARPGQVLLDRVAQRVGRALRLDEAQTSRLRGELQTSREERARIAARAREIRQELQRLVQQSSPDEGRVGELLDESARLEVAAGQVAVDEQRRLAEFMTPLQRARFVWVRERLAQEALGRRDTVPGGGPIRPR